MNNAVEDAGEGEPDASPSITQRIKAPHDKVYVTITYDAGGDIVGVIANSGNSGGLRRAGIEAAYELATQAMNEGADPRAVAESLVDIRGPKIEWDNGDPIYSDADAIGVAIIRFLDDKVQESIKEGGEYRGE